MLEFYTWAILLKNERDEIGEKQLSVFGSRGGQNSPLMHIPLCTSMPLASYKIQHDKHVLQKKRKNNIEWQCKSFWHRYNDADVMSLSQRHYHVIFCYIFKHQNIFTMSCPHRYVDTTHPR